jgi:hypothetical protein
MASALADGCEYFYQVSRSPQAVARNGCARPRPHGTMRPAARASDRRECLCAAALLQRRAACSNQSSLTARQRARAWESRSARPAAARARPKQPRMQRRARPPRRIRAHICGGRRTTTCGSSTRGPTASCACARRSPCGLNPQPAAHGARRTALGRTRAKRAARACVRAARSRVGACACVRACVRACVQGCVCVCVCAQRRKPQHR